MASPSPDLSIKLNYTQADYQVAYQTRKNGTYKKPCASDLVQVLMSDLVGDIILSLNTKNATFMRALRSPTKSRRCRPRNPNPEAVGKRLEDTEAEKLDFIITCLKRWLPENGQCFGVPLPSTEDVVSCVYKSTYAAGYDSDEDEAVPPKKKRCNLGTHFIGAVYELLHQLRNKMEAENTFGHGQGKELVVSIGNLVMVGQHTAECCLSTVKGGRTTVTADVEWDDGAMGEFISTADAEIFINKCSKFVFEIKKDNNCLGESQLGIHLLFRAALQHTPVMGIIVSGEKHRLLYVDEGHDVFTVKELDKYDLTDRASLIRFVEMLFIALRGVPVDGGASTSEGQAVSTTAETTSTSQ